MRIIEDLHSQMIAGRFQPTAPIRVDLAGLPDQRVWPVRQTVVDGPAPVRANLAREPVRQDGGFSPARGLHDMLHKRRNVGGPERFAPEPIKAPFALRLRRLERAN